MSTLALTGLHARYQLLETVRVPIAVVGMVLFPALTLAFFVLPQSALTDDPALATASVSQLALFAVMSTFTFTYGAGVSEDRAQPFDAYVRTLPAGPVPRLGGRLVSGTLFGLVSLLPLVLLGWLFTSSSPSGSQLVGGIGMVMVAALPFMFTGLAIGYGLSAKAALPIAQLVLFPMAFGGGLFLPPQMFPDWLDAVSGFLPSRAGRDVVVQATTGAGATGADYLILAIWSVALAALAVWTYRRDEGRRFR